VRRAIDTVIASMSAIPTKIAPANAPVAPNVSPTARPSTMINPRKKRKSHHRPEIERIAKIHALMATGVGLWPVHPNDGEPGCHQCGSQEGGRDQHEETRLERCHDGGHAEEHDSRRDRDAGRKQTGRPFTPRQRIGGMILRL
jgi:hypothetical protein